MLVLSLKSQIEQAVNAAPNEWRLSGNANVDDLFDPEHARQLDAAFADVAFAFLAFHPGADRAVREYVEGGSLASDAGPNVLALLTLPQEAALPVDVADDAFLGWLQLDAEEQPSYRMIRSLFEPDQAPPLPGIAVFERTAEPCEAVYFSLAGLDVDGVRDRVRRILGAAGHARIEHAEQGGRSLADRLAVWGQKERLPVERSKRVSMRQWLVRGYQFVGAVIALATL
jgi:hypothetical protein